MFPPASLFSRVNCVVFDFGFTLCPDLYFNVAPPEIPQWQQIFQQRIFNDSALVQRWMANIISSADIAQIISAETGLKAETTLYYMQAGCRRLAFNPAVMAFAQAQRGHGRKTALVTGNMDIFTQVVVPAHGLEQVFDVIINSADYGETNKQYLWPLAFRRLGPGIGYTNSLLIEDTRMEVERFRQFGGLAYRYTGDDDFIEWLKKVNGG